MHDLFIANSEADALRSAPKLKRITKIICTTAEDSTITVGNDRGTSMSVTCDFATTEIVRGILEELEDFRYQPFQADRVAFDPAAEIGDAISVGGVVSGMWNVDLIFGTDLLADISAPTDEEINHEYPYSTDQDIYATKRALARGTCAVNGSGVMSGTITTQQTSSGILASLMAADFSSDVFNNRDVAPSVRTNQLVTNRILLTNPSYQLEPMLLQYKNQFGGNSAVWILGYYPLEEG